MSWKALCIENAELAEFGEQRLNGQVAYLATIKKDGSPRLHPVTPIIGDGCLFLFMEPSSPKGHDLRRDGRYALHCSVANSDGEGGEFLITGVARFVEDQASRVVATRFSSYKPADRYILFELGVDSAFSTVYQADGKPLRNRWGQ